MHNAGHKTKAVLVTATDIRLDMVILVLFFGEGSVLGSTLLNLVDNTGKRASAHWVQERRAALPMLLLTW